MNRTRVKGIFVSACPNGALRELPIPEDLAFWFRLTRGGRYPSTLRARARRQQPPPLGSLRSQGSCSFALHRGRASAGATIITLRVEDFFRTSMRVSRLLASRTVLNLHRQITYTTGYIASLTSNVHDPHPSPCPADSTRHERIDHPSTRS